MENYRVLIYVTGGIIALFVYLYLSSIIYFFLAKVPGSAMPWSVIQAAFHPPHANTSSQLWLAFGAPIALLLAVGAQIQKIIGGQNNGLPSADWAKTSDIKKAGLLQNNGLVLGKYNGQFLMSNSPTHVMVVAPTRSGKGVGLVTPNLLNFTGSIICLDLKHENFKNSSGFRKEFSEVYKWSPMAEDGKTHCYNPLSTISKNKYRRITDLQIFATTLIKEPPKGDPMWAEEAQALFIGLALYVLETEKNPTIGAINRLLSAEGDLGDICRHITQTHRELPESIIKPMNKFANKAAKERSGVKTTITKALKLWDNPVVDAATSRSDFDISQIRKKRMTIYVSVGTEEIATLAPLLRIFFEQTIKTLSKNEPKDDEPHQVLMLMDEFHMLGHMDVMTSAFSLLAGYNVRVMAVVQSLNWLDTVYDRATRNGILSCCAHQIFFASNDPDTEDYVSKACGEKTVPVESVSKRNSMQFEPATRNTSYRTLPLIARHEVRTFDSNKQIVLVEANKPIIAKKIRFHEDKKLIPRASLKPPELKPISVQETRVPKFNLKPGNKTIVEKPKAKTAPQIDDNNMLEDTLNLAKSIKQN